jgi:hypothetical protein
MVSEFFLSETASSSVDPTGGWLFYSLYIGAIIQKAGKSLLCDLFCDRMSSGKGERITIDAIKLLAV